MIVNNIRAFFKDPQAYKVETVQTVWSGYGEIARFFVPRNSKTYIGKVIRLDKVTSHPRGWNTDFAHQRKLSSYHNEQEFYQHYAILSDSNWRVPFCYTSARDPNFLWMILEDLDATGYSLRYTNSGNMDITKVAKAGLKWLAYFHAKFLGTTNEISIQHTWPIGTYWHLATRPDEWQTMPDSALKKAASKIDQTLERATYKTQLHGDAKLTNFCFAKATGDAELPTVAALDFQYTGVGVGIKDVVYFLGSCCNDLELNQHADNLLAFYFKQLQQAHHHYQKGINFDELETQWRALYCFAWADFERFLAGWSPNHHKLTSYSNEQTIKALSDLSL